MKNKCKELKETKVKNYMKVYECKRKKNIYYNKKETCKDCPKIYLLNFE